VAKQKRKETQKEQSKRFKKAAQDMIADGELNPIDAEKALNRIIDGIKTPKGN